MFRKIIELATRSVVIKRRLPHSLGRRPFYVAADAALGYLRPTLPGKDLFDIVDQFVVPGAHVWDLGANVGLFTFAAAHRAGSTGSVLAIEADIWLASLIRRSAELSANRDLRIDVLPVAVSDKYGIARFLIAQRGRASNALETSGARSQAGGTRSVQYVPTMTLDSLLSTFPAPSVLKIDVEGAEVMVLEGASDLLYKHRPIIYCEVGTEQNSDIARIFKSHRYAVCDAGTPSQLLDHCPFNTLAIPYEKLPTKST